MCISCERYAHLLGSSCERYAHLLGSMGSLSVVHALFLPINFTHDLIIGIYGFFPAH